MKGLLWSSISWVMNPRCWYVVCFGLIVRALCSLSLRCFYFIFIFFTLFFGFLSLVVIPLFLIMLAFDFASWDFLRLDR